MTLKRRLERLEDVLRGSDNSEEATKRTREYARAWAGNDAEGMALFKEFEDYCMKTGHYTGGRKSMVEITRNDPIAEGLARKYLESYRNYVKTHYGVIVDEVDSAFGKA